MLPFRSPAQSRWQPRLLIVASKPIFRAALCWALSRHSGDWELVEAGSIVEARQMLDARRCALVVLDADVVGADAAAAEAGSKSILAVPTIWLTAGDAEAGAGEKRLAGILGQVAKASPLEEIAASVGQFFEQALRAPSAKQQLQADDQDVLTPAQRKVLLLMERGQLNKQIAFELNIAESTVKAHVGAIFRKLKVQNRVQATLAAQRQQPHSW